MINRYNLYQNDRFTNVCDGIIRYINFIAIEIPISNPISCRLSSCRKKPLSPTLIFKSLAYKLQIYSKKYFQGNILLDLALGQDLIY